MFSGKFESFNASAFNGCTALTTIIFTKSGVVVSGSGLFTGVNTTNLKIYVPDETTKILYLADSFWSNFTILV